MMYPGSNSLLDTSSLVMSATFLSCDLAPWVPAISRNPLQWGAVHNCQPFARNERQQTVACALVSSVVVSACKPGHCNKQLLRGL